ncbi:unnamed protein product [Symbiodinium sp. CCMP2592]|nr:unnamed protein product [Symbiodinium sp. CCMP2592]
MDASEAAPREVPPEDGGVHDADDNGGLPAVEQAMEEGDTRLMGARVDDEVREPGYDAAEPLGQQGEAHGSQGNHGETQEPSQVPAVSSSDRQRPVPAALTEGVREAGETVAPLQSEERAVSVERRSEEVGQVARSLAFMTNLVTTLVGRMDRVEQNQSRGGSSASMRRTTATEGRMETPMGGTPEAGSLGYVDMERLNAQLGMMQLAEGVAEPCYSWGAFGAFGYAYGTFGAAWAPGDDFRGVSLGAATGNAAGIFTNYGAVSEYDSGIFAKWCAVSVYASGILSDSYAPSVYASGILSDGYASSVYASELFSDQCAAPEYAAGIFSNRGAVFAYPSGILAGEYAASDYVSGGFDVEWAAAKYASGISSDGIAGVRFD